MNFPTKLAALMRRHGVGNRRLAEALGISHPPVGEWLKGIRRPKPDAAKQLADFLGITVDDLLDDTRDLPLDPVVSEAPANYSAAPDDSQVQRLSEAIAELERQVTALREARAEEMAARRKALDDELIATPGVANALAAGISLDEIRQWIMGEITRRQGKKNLEEIVTRGRAGKSERKQA